MYDLAKMRSGSEPVDEYLEAAVKNYPAFAKRLKEYRLDKEAVIGIKKLRGKAIVVVFSAEWCPDCVRNVPVLGLLSRETGLEVRVFGHLMRNPLSPTERWKCPPSPPECKEFNVIKIPLILVFDQKGEKLGEIVENPPAGVSLEGALLDILKKA